MKKLRKSVFAALLCAALVVSMTACGSGGKEKAEPLKEPPPRQGAEQTGQQDPAGGDADGQNAQGEAAPGQQEPETPAEAAGQSGTQFAAQDNVDLTGNWAQKDAETEESYMAGYVSGTLIEIFFMSEHGKQGSLYWSGTYVPQTTPGTPYTWESVNDRGRTGQAAMASDSDTKTFSYENGELSFPVTVLGQTTMMTMTRSTQNYSIFSPGGGASFSTDGQPVEVQDRVYTWFTLDNGGCLLYYEMTLRNPNPGSAIRNSQIQVTARGEDDSVLATREQTVPVIAAGDTIMFGDVLSYEGPSPASVEMIASNGADAYVSQDGSPAPGQSDLPVANGLEKVNENDTVYTGEVTNNSGKDLDAVRLSVVFRKGDEIVGGMGDIVTGVKNGETKPFELQVTSSLPEHDSFEIVAQAWDPQFTNPPMQ
ncbi:MAG: FxLYD domain-containing protein [Eubacteriales bacterium]|nr:FxLYD domain-containing protein [Eubacteriales bacterium]